MCCLCQLRKLQGWPHHACTLTPNDYGCISSSLLHRPHMVTCVASATSNLVHYVHFTRTRPLHRLHDGCRTHTFTSIPNISHSCHSPALHDPYAIISRPLRARSHRLYAQHISVTRPFVSHPLNCRFMTVSRPLDIRYHPQYGRFKPATRRPFFGVP